MDWRNFQNSSFAEYFRETVSEEWFETLAKRLHE